jgi:DNA polymerase-3 subunit epsilon
MPWFDERLSPLDFETTSTDVEEARIVQAACGFVGGGLAPEMVTIMANPGVAISEDAAAVHGITTERAESEGHPARDVVGVVRNVVQSAIDQGYPIVAYSARFDLTILDRECRRHGIDPPNLPKVRVVDPLVLDKWLDRFRRGSRRLDATCAHYGVELGADDAHDAGADAMAAARLAWRILHKSDAVQGRHPEIVQRRAFWKKTKGDLPLLHEAQAVWAAEQAVGLRAYFNGQGKHDEAASVQEAWPWVPFEEKVIA